MDRHAALEMVKTDPYTGGEETLDYCLKKLDFTHEEFEKIMNDPPQSFLDYKSYYPLVKSIEKPIKWGTKAGFDT